MVKILLVGSNGLVGYDLKRILNENNYYDITECNSNNFTETLVKLDKFDVVFNCANEIVSQQIYQMISVINKKPVYIDNSSYLRLMNIPLVVPEINMTDSLVYANPNCVTIILSLFLNAIKKFNPRNIKVSTYQSISGSGRGNLDLFLKDTQKVLDYINKEPFTNIPINRRGFNFYPHESKIICDGFNSEEYKVMKETKKILGLDVFPTCIRIPSIRCHGESVTCELDEVTITELDMELHSHNIIVSDNINGKESEKKSYITVGHIRRNPFNKNEWNFFIVGDQITRGASYNAFKIFENKFQTV